MTRSNSERMAEADRRAAVRQRAILEAEKAWRGRWPRVADDVPADVVGRCVRCDAWLYADDTTCPDCGLEAGAADVVRPPM